MNFLVNQIRDQKVLEIEVEVDKFIEENGISNEAVIHTMVFDKSVFEKEEEVREYLKNVMCHWKPDIVEEGDFFKAVLVSPNQINIETEVTVELRRGVTAMAADLVPVTCFDEVCFNDKGDVNLSSKIETINLSEGLPHIIEIARVAEGEHPNYGKIKITQETLESIEANFNSGVTGVDLAINEDHKKNEAFGWFKDVFLSYDKQTLYGQIAWNAKGTTALSEKEYRYFSPEFRFNYIHPHTGEEHGATLLGGALTNYPFLKMEAIVELNNKNLNNEDNVSKETTIDLSVHNEKVIELSEKNSKLQVELNEKTTENNLLKDKVKKLEQTIELNTKKSAHEKLFNEGLINAAQLKAMNEGKSMLEVISLSDKMNTKGKGSSETPSNDDIELSDGDKSIMKSLGLTEEEFKAVEL